MLIFKYNKQFFESANSFAMCDAINNLKEYHTQDVLMNYLNLPMSSTLM